MNASARTWWRWSASSRDNAPTVVGTAQATGVVVAAAARRGIPVAWHTPSEVRGSR
ncbi:crossover junction endodeoxyribonuclease RuvC [Kocuria rhizophila]|nr:crossover junction endodeoxyribonuclease RuvC [Kocuria rhizophila]